MGKELEYGGSGNSLPALFGTGGTRGLERRTKYQLAQIIAESGLSRAEVDAAADVEMSKVSAIGDLGQCAMAEQVKLTQARKALAAGDAELEASLASTQQITMVLMQNLMLGSARRISRIN